MDPDEARRRILDELAKGEYGRGTGLLGWLKHQLGLLLEALQEGMAGSPGALPVLAVVLALGALALAVLLRRRSGPLRRQARWNPQAALDADPSAPAAELLERAQAARTADERVVLAMRALVRDLEERTVLEVTDGMTAHEAAHTAGRAFPDVRSRLSRTASAFDTAAYSHRSATPKQAEDAVLLAQYIAQTTPDLHDEQEAAGQDAQIEESVGVAG